MTAALLHSGGLDSTCAWYVLGKPAAVYCGGSFGPARHANLGEMAAIEALCNLDPSFANALRVIEFDFRPFMRAGVWNMPREQILVQLAWAAGYDRLMIAYVADDGLPPAMLEYQSRNFGLAVGMAGLVVDFPVADMTKRELVQRALQAGMPPEVVEASHSCLRQSDGHCGACVNCRQRAAALAGIISRGVAI